MSWLHDNAENVVANGFKPDNDFDVFFELNRICSGVNDALCLTHCGVGNGDVAEGFVGVVNDRVWQVRPTTRAGRKGRQPSHND